MQINRRITNGLAWAGLALVVGVPAADFVSARLMDEPQSVAVVANAVAPVPAPADQRPEAPAEVDAIETAAAEPAKPAAKPAVSNDVVDSYLASGRKLPSYITGGDEPAAEQVAVTPKPAAEPARPVDTAPKPTEVAATPAQPVTTAPAAEEPIDVAALPPQKVAPVPMPLSMRPRPVSQPLANRPAVDPIVIPQEAVGGYDAQVTQEDLADWETGPLSDFLAEREGRGNARSEASYSRDGFYLDEYPVQPQRGTRYIGPVEEEFFLPFFD